MVIDCHVHMENDTISRGQLRQKLQGSRIDGMVAISIAPESVPAFRDKEYSTEERLDILMRWCEGMPELHPVYWVDPTEKDAVRQVEQAAERGVAGFKIICNHFYPGDGRAMPVYRKIAQTGKALMFHSGILWDAQPSSRYNRPAEFEELLPVEGLRFALAHISWPWTDECVAVLGKFQDAARHLPHCARMYVDITRGTPDLFREEALRKLLLTGYDVEKSVFFGSDCTLDHYDVSLCEDYITKDLQLFSKLGINDAFVRRIFSENIREFYGF